MIESCTKKRMLVGITLLGGLTILVLIVESQWTDSKSDKSHLKTIEHNTTHTSTSEYEVTSCQPCPSIENTSNHNNNSNKNNSNSKSLTTTCCDKAAWLIERKFLKFEGAMFGLAVLSCMSVYLRENVLRKRVIRKVARQLRASV